MKVVYICHPIGGAVRANIKLILQIVKRLNLDENPSVVPYAPYLADVLAMDDSNDKHRAKGLANSAELFARRVIDEVWVYGNSITDGMHTEIVWAKAVEIPVISKSEKIPQHLIDSI